jgi:protein-tyrosine-phosphatase
LLGEFAGRAGDRAEIKDPFGAELEQYRETYRELAGLMPAVAERLASRA